MAIIPSFFLNAVVAIGVDGNDGQKYWIGTGFIVGRKESDNPGMSTYYIITNKHVIEQQQCVYVRFNSLGGTLVKDYRVNLYDDMLEQELGQEKQKKKALMQLLLTGIVRVNI